MSNIDVSELVAFQKQIYEKVKHTTVFYNKTENQDLYEAIIKVFGDDIPDGQITLDMMITCLEVVKKAAANKADSILARF
jgi:RNA binding exosome subunit